MLSFIIAFLLPLTAALKTADDVTGRLPALGWNSWNAYRCNIDAGKILSAARQMRDLGLQSAGYEYVNIDDCWSVKSHRDPGTGRLLPNMTKFPEGIKGLVDTIHRLGFKVGIYSDAGTSTCGGYPGSLYYEDIDAATFAEWGIDYLKYDNCNVPESWPKDKYHNCHPDYNHPKGPNNTCINDLRVAPSDYDWGTSWTAARFRRMGDELRKQSRTILYSLCEWGTAGVEHWGKSMAQSWRVTDDIFPHWDKIVHISKYNSHILNNVDFFGHNDADMLDLGNGALTVPECRTHFALWAAMKSPLLIGTDLAKLSRELVQVLKNKALLDFNQDSIVGKPATPFQWDYTSPAEYWAGDYSNGNKLVLMVNYDDTKKVKSVDLSSVPGLEPGRKYRVLDAWSRREECVRTLKRHVERHDTAAVVVRGEC